MNSVSSERKYPKGYLAGLLLVVLCSLAILLGPVLSGKFFSDDWEFQLGHPGDHILGAFVQTHPYKLYRPIQLMITAISQVLYGSSTLPVHAANLMFHTLLTALCLAITWRIGGGTIALAVTAATFVVSQLNAPALGGNDTLSLVLGTLAGTQAMWCMWLSRHKADIKFAVLSILAYCVALLAKESSFGYLPVLCWLSGPFRKPVGMLRGLPAICLATLSVGMLLWRSHLGADGPDFTSSHSGFSLGSNIVVNSLMVGFAALTPVSTLDIFSGAHLHVMLWPLCGAVGAIIIATIACVGVNSYLGIRGLVFFVLAGGCIVGPVVIQRHVSELYSYALLPIVAVGLGLGAERLWNRKSLQTRVCLIVILAICAILNATAEWRNARSMARNGRRAGPLMNQLVAIVRALPSSGSLFLINPRPRLPEYSVYRMNNFRLTPPEEIERLAGRSDIAVTVTELDSLPRTLSQAQVVYTLGEDLELKKVEQ